MPDGGFIFDIPLRSVTSNTCTRYIMFLLYRLKGMGWESLMVISLHCILQMSLYDFVIISIFFYLWSLRVAVPLDNSRVSARVSRHLCGFPPQC